MILKSTLGLSPCEPKALQPSNFSLFTIQTYIVHAHCVPSYTISFIVLPWIIERRKGNCKWRAPVDDVGYDDRKFTGVNYVEYSHTVSGAPSLHSKLTNRYCSSTSAYGGLRRLVQEWPSGSWAGAMIFIYDRGHFQNTADWK